GGDLVGKVGGVPCAAAMDGLRIPPHPVLALGKVRYVGEPVVAVVADDPYRAYDAVEEIEAIYEALPAVTDPEGAAASKAPVLHEEYGDNIAFRWNLGGGDIDAAFAAADHVVKARLVHQRLVPNAMEPRGVLARYFPGEKELTIWTSTQIPHLARSVLAGLLRVPPHTA